MLGNPVNAEALQALSENYTQKITKDLMTAIELGKTTEVVLYRGQLMTWESLLSRIRAACNDYTPPVIEG